MRLRVGLALGLLAGLGAAAAADTGPDGAVRAFMGRYYADDVTLSWSKPAEAKRVLTPRLAKLVAHPKKDVDSDFIIEGQDWQVRNLKTAVARQDEASATVTATFDNIDEKVAEDFRLRKVGEAWLIDDLCRGATCLSGDYR